MLAAQVRDLGELVFPLIATPKIDGIRCLTLLPRDGQECSVVTRTLKPIPNYHIRALISARCCPGLDGELVVPGVSFHRTASMVMSHMGAPTFKYCVFDHMSSFSDVRWVGGLLERYAERLLRLSSLELPPFCEVVKHHRVRDKIELEDYEAQCIEGGYEGVCLRTDNSPYKFGRSTLREHWLLKLKRFEESEAEIIGSEELMHNHNLIETSELGYGERSSHRSGMIPGKMLGALLVKDVRTGVEFKVGSGFAENERRELWSSPKSLIGRIITYRHQPHGAKDKPRGPTFKGFRDTSQESSS